MEPVHNAVRFLKILLEHYLKSPKSVSEDKVFMQIAFETKIFFPYLVM